MAHDAAEVACGHSVWESADILPLDTWVVRCWNLLLDSGDTSLPLLLSRSQESVLWESCVREHLRGEPPERQLLQVGVAARNAQIANVLLKAWRVALDDHAFDLNEDTRAFGAWLRIFERRCVQQGFVEPARATERIVECVLARQVPTPTQVTVAGFGDLNPQQAALLDAFQGIGVAVKRLEPSLAQAAGLRVGFADQAAELEAAARYARGILEDGGTGPIGIVVPDLERNRTRVEEIFDDVLRPGAVLPHHGEGERPFNLSLGVPLSSLTVVHHALLGLGLNNPRGGFAEVSEFVRSPYVAFAERELSERARLDAALRADAELEVPLWRLVRVVGRGPNRGWGTHFSVPELETCLKALLKLTRAAPRRQRLSAWSATFAECLKALGWPGERRLDSATYQAVERFRELLAELATLDVMLGELSYANALARLKVLAAECVFQPRSGPAPVQILGLLESEGLAFTHLWVSGLHDQRWPEAHHPNPFIPVAMQRKLEMPHASAEWELAAARRFMRMWRHSAEKLVMSYPRNEGDEALRSSPLLAEFEEVATDALPQSRVPTYRHQLQRSQATREDIFDYTGPAVAKGASVRGGTSLFKDQGACPFRAFATHRLGAGGLDEPVPGLNARARGTVVHRLLELLWSELKSQHRLLALDASGLDEMVDASVVKALNEQARSASFTLTGRFFELERARLKALASDWLVEERKRSAFEVVAPEQRRIAHIGGLPVRIQPDRVDRLADGSYLLIDYKTGKPRLDDWFDERIEEPQLPIYCSAFENNDNQLDLFEPKTVGGVAFGVLRSDQVGYKGVAEEPDVAPGILALDKAKPAREFSGWPQLKRAWRERLDALAEEFLCGDARVAPKSGAKTCTYCDIKPVCRINEILRRAGDACNSGGADM